MENLFDFYYSDFMVGVRDLAVYFKTDDLLNVSFKPKYWSYLPFLYWSYLPFLYWSYLAFLFWSYLPFLYWSYLPFLYWS
jgi:hypothetical protein